MKNKTLLAFCLKVALLLVILFGIDRLVGNFFVSMKNMGLAHNPYHQWEKTARLLEKCDEACLVIGSSKAEHSYVTEMMSDSLGIGKIYNAGQGGCFFLYQNCVINMLLDRRVPKKIIWDIQPECIPADSRMKEYQNVRYLSPYYDSDSWAKDFINSEDERATIKMQCHMFRYNTKLFQYLLPIVTRKVKADSGYKPLPNDGYIYPTLKLDLSNEDNTDFNEYKINVFSETLRRCKEKGVDITLFVSPSFVLPSTRYKNSVKKLTTVANDYGYNLLDYSDDVHFLSDSTLFKDVSHLNDKGARMYTKLVIFDIKNK